MDVKIDGELGEQPAIEAAKSRIKPSKENDLSH